MVHPAQSRSPDVILNPFPHIQSINQSCPPYLGSPITTSNPSTSPARPTSDLQSHPDPSSLAGVTLPSLSFGHCSRLLTPRLFSLLSPSRQPESSLDKISFLRAAVNDPWLCFSTFPGYKSLSLSLVSSSHTFCHFHSQTPKAHPCHRATELVCCICLKCTHNDVWWLLLGTKVSTLRWPAQRCLF